jgi:hypothetical protein
MKSILWAAQWRSKNKLDGERSYIMRDRCLPKLFYTKKECSDWIVDNYGYIAKRKDLRNEPHGWRMPKPVKVKVELTGA